MSLGLKGLMEEKSQFDFSHNTLRLQPQCFAAFGFIKAPVDPDVFLFTFRQAVFCGHCASHECY